MEAAGVDEATSAIIYYGMMLCDWIIRHTTLKWMVPESANAKKSEKE